MKRFLIFFLLLALLTGCSPQKAPADIAATTLPIYEFTTRLCAGTGLTVTRLVTENVSCLHDYALNVRQVRAAEAADVIVINGAGLEEFMEDLLSGADVIDSSRAVTVLEAEGHHDHDHHGHDHAHESDSHTWLSPENAMVMAETIAEDLSVRYPEHAGAFAANLSSLLSDITSVQTYADEQLGSLACRDLLTFHDGFSYLAHAFDLHIVHAIEEESGSEASAAELKHMIEITREHSLPAVFVEANGSCSAASIIAAETGARVFTLDMAMSGESWFDAMYHNIDTLKEALE